MVLNDPQRVRMSRIANESSEAFDDRPIGFTASVLFDALSRGDPDVVLHRVKKRPNQGRLSDPQFPRDEYGSARPAKRLLELRTQPTDLVFPAHHCGPDFIKWRRFLATIRIFPAGLPGVDFIREGVDGAQRRMTVSVHRQPFARFPATNGCDIAAQVRRDFLP